MFLPAGGDAPALSRDAVLAAPPSSPSAVLQRRDSVGALDSVWGLIASSLYALHKRCTSIEGRSCLLASSIEDTRNLERSTVMDDTDTKPPSIPRPVNAGLAGPCISTLDRLLSARVSSSEALWVASVVFCPNILTAASAKCLDSSSGGKRRRMLVALMKLIAGAVGSGSIIDTPFMMSPLALLIVPAMRRPGISCLTVVPCLGRRITAVEKWMSGEIKTGVSKR
mmetsp:Transcript_14178/g.28028  ORF Transcript_14178/g.28028 Transcript_14178/m.28028 type:complete len:225 (+) Transcript_14178:522-1196(+)